MRFEAHFKADNARMHTQSLLAITLRKLVTEIYLQELELR